MNIQISNGLGLVDLKILALWNDIILVEGWNSHTPYVVSHVYENKGNYFLENGKYYQNKDDALEEWKVSQRYGVCSVLHSRNDDRNGCVVVDH